MGTSTIEKILKKIQDLTFEVDLLPAIIHQSVRSLASYRVTYASPVPGNLISQTYMYPKVPDDAGRDRRTQTPDRHSQAGDQISRQ